MYRASRMTRSSLCGITIRVSDHVPKSQVIALNRDRVDILGCTRSYCSETARANDH
jgi:hypothetical protein